MYTASNPSDLWLHLRGNLPATLSLLFLVLIVLLACFAPWLAPYSYFEQDLNLGSVPPSLAHWMGTDNLGRDMLTRILYGSRISLLVGFVATAVALLIGVTYGVIAGYFGGWIDTLMMRFIDILYGVPFILLVILLMVTFGQSLLLLFVAIAALEWMTTARIVRSQVLSLRNREFIQAAEVIGVSKVRLLWNHFIPNTLGVIIVYGTLTIPNIIILEAFLSFLGLGVQPPQSSWGLLINYGVASMESSPWQIMFPALAFSSTLLALNVLGDGLRDLLDPRIASRSQKSV